MFRLEMVTLRGLINEIDGCHDYIRREIMVLIGLVSDFGLKDAYVAQMKAVILSLSPAAVIVDISHEIARHDVHQGMFVLASAAPYFPSGTIFLAVVDPEVGGSRRPLLLETGKSKFVGPDNGILALAAEKEGLVRAYHLTESKYFAGNISPTFHGRDIFAYVVGHLANGVSPALMGQPVSDYVRLKISEARLEGRDIQGKVIHVDGFGNVVTNIHPELLERGGFESGGRLKLRIKGKMRDISLCRTYSDVASGELLATIGGHGFLELAVNQGDAAKLTGAKVGTSITFHRVGLSV